MEGRIDGDRALGCEIAHSIWPVGPGAGTEVAATVAARVGDVTCARSAVVTLD